MLSIPISALLSGTSFFQQCLKRIGNWNCAIHPYVVVRSMGWSPLVSPSGYSLKNLVHPYFSISYLLCGALYMSLGLLRILRRWTDFNPPFFFVLFLPSTWVLCMPKHLAVITFEWQPFINNPLSDQYILLIAKSINSRNWPSGGISTKILAYLNIDFSLVYLPVFRGIPNNFPIYLDSNPPSIWCPILRVESRLAGWQFGLYWYPVQDSKVG